MTDELQLFDGGMSWNLDSDWSVREVSDFTAERWMADHHYLGTAGTAEWRFGVFPAASDAIAVVVISRPSNVDGVTRKYGLERFPGNMEITRVAVHPDAPKNTASRSVALAVDALTERSDVLWVFSYADTGQGHHGGIYQALNAVYVGVSEARPGYLLDGQPFHPRSMVAKYGSQSRQMLLDLQAAGVDIVKVDDANSAKHTYVLPCGTPAQRRAVRKALERHARPYPKRDHAGEGSRESRLTSGREGQVRSLDPALIDEGDHAIS